jgi:hypothetical protein
MADEKLRPWTPSEERLADRNIPVMILVPRR